jgi:hypothetical protein
MDATDKKVERLKAAILKNIEGYLQSRSALKQLLQADPKLDSYGLTIEVRNIETERPLWAAISETSALNKRENK